MIAWFGNKVHCNIALVCKSSIYMKADLCQIQEKIGRRRPEGAGIEEGKPESTTAG
jgi:hypothetical protein